MGTAREIMHGNVECVNGAAAVSAAASKMHDLHIGALPICDSEGTIQGMVTDRDIVVRCVAAGRSTQTTTAEQVATKPAVWVNADADEAEVLRLMEEHKIRRLPVIEKGRPVGMISEADVVTHLTDEQITEFTEAIYAAPATS